MKNTVTVQVNFSFRGEDFSPTMELELDAYAKINDGFNHLYPAIAQANDIDTYSYAYEVMEASSLVFNNPQGNVVDFVNEGQCDLAAYKHFLQETEMLGELEKIAEATLSVDLHKPENDGIKTALIAAYKAGDS